MSFKNRLFFRVIAAVTLMVYISVPVLAQSSVGSGDYFDGRARGEKDASGNPLWFFGGFCLGGVGVLLALILEPNPQTQHLVGQSSTYILGYIDGYQSKAKKQNIYYAVAGMATVLVLYLILLATVLAEEPDGVY